MATNLGSNSAKSAYYILTFIRSLGIPKRIGISQYWFQKAQWDDLATSCESLV